MTFFFSRISISSLSEKYLKIFHYLDHETYDLQLAGQVAEKLKGDPTSFNDHGYYQVSSGIDHSHRDYCGVGLYFFDGKFTLGEVNDSMRPYPVLISFENQTEFVRWLGNQSDQRMSLYCRNSFNNQTITKIRLEYFLGRDYDPVWNAYCAYVRNGNKIG